MSISELDVDCGSFMICFVMLLFFLNTEDYNEIMHFISSTVLKCEHRRSHKQHRYKTIHCMGQKNK